MQEYKNNISLILLHYITYLSCIHRADCSDIADARV